MPIVVPYCTITGKSVGLNNQVYAGSVIVSINLSSMFLEQTDSSWQEVQNTSFSVATDSLGNWSASLPQPSACDPVPTVTIKEPNGNTWVGTVPSSVGPFTIHDLKASPYSWSLSTGTPGPIFAIVSGGTTSDVHIIDGSVGTQKLAIDATGRIISVLSDPTTPSQKLAIDSGGHLGSVISDGTTPSQKLLIDANGALSARSSPQKSLTLNLTSGGTPVSLLSSGFTGPSCSIDGYNGGVTFQILFTYGTIQSDTCTLAVQGTLDGTIWYTVPFQPLDATPSPVPVISVPVGGTASSSHLYQVTALPLTAVRLSCTTVQSAGASNNWSSSTLAGTLYTMPI